ncbi:MAG: tRNA (N6-isopentenyl adenosine(37)-C2)-methylthiotransferase MiaB [Thermoguttaceae bacterium]|nr:tRNA (N6-isopentenyl adenosine(37)-C2)-methylthiotransferase MiaB [Planctomycetaceae bacterium]MBQ4143541.1 tRNA (N6-isopentenyl adenosine(37)-C2)-methylthiotransferase MiaB [Thermoguttaceae bacterium]
MPSFFIETVGCQMNVLDSELIIATLLREGFTQAESMKKADVILFNTCSIRQHAEDKIYSALGRLRLSKEAHPEKIIGVMGCMAQKDNKQIFKRAPYVDLVVGPGQIARIPELLAKIRAGKGPQMELSLERRGRGRHEVEDSFDFYDPMREASARQNPFMAYVRIMFGCDQFCTYCIVPYVRGPEQSRPVDEILAEVRQLVDQGCREVTLIGQTVSKYHDQPSGTRLSGLLEQCERIAETTPLERIRFVTSHPNSMTPDLFEAVRDLPHVMPYFHVPAQSGSNAQLKRMNRGYTVEKYRDVCRQILETVPGAAITSDFIVGFCGETEEDFQQTVELVKDIRFKNSFIFKFSPREGTKAYELWEDDVPEEVKRRRNNELLAVQNQISTEESAKFVGQEVEILVEGTSKSAMKLPLLDGAAEFPEAVSDSNSIIQLTGRTPCDRIVVFDGPRSLIGNLQKVRITDSSPFTLFGEI